MAGLAAGVSGLAAGYLLKTTVVMALALLAAAAAKKRPAAFRHFILSSALIGLLLLPFLSLAPVGWRAPLWPSWMAASNSPRTAEPAAMTRGGRAGSSESGTLSSVEIGLAPAAGTAGAGASVGLPDDGAAGRAGARDPSVPAAGQTVRVKPVSPAPGRDAGAAGPLGLILAIAWSAGLAALLLRLAIGLAGASRLTAQGAPLDGASWRALVERFFELLPLRRPVRLKSHPQVLVPMTWGWRKPVVLFPDGADAWNDDERSAALCHELSHVKRADFLIMLLVRAGLALFWWNPLCWIVYRELLKEQEIACDELVLRAGIRPSAYAASLLAFRRSAGLRWSPSAALPGLLGRSPFQERLAAILRQKLIFMEVKMKTKITVALALVAAVALVGTARPAAGRDIAAPKTVLAETAVPAAAALSPVLEAQAIARTAAEPAAVQETQKEQEKAKAAEKAQAAAKAEKDKKAVEKKIVVKAKGDKSPIEITITEGDHVKNLVLDHSVTITRSENGDVLVLTPEGKEPIMLKGEPLRIEIKGGTLELMREGLPLDIDKDVRLKVGHELGKEGKTIVFYGTEPEVAAGHVKVIQGSALEEVRPEVFTRIRTDRKEGETWVEAKPAVKEGEAAAAWTVVGPDLAPIEADGRFLLQGKPNHTVWIAGNDQDMLKKVQALEEQVQAIKAKKMDLSALEESLKKLEAELKAKEEKLRTFEYKFNTEPGREPVHGVVLKKITGEGPEKGVAVEIREGAAAMEAAEDAAAERTDVVKVQAKNDGTIGLVFTSEAGPGGQKAYERAVTRLKKELPEGYKIVEQKYDAETGAMTFRIAGPKDAKTDETLIKKLVDSLRSELDKQ